MFKADDRVFTTPWAHSLLWRFVVIFVAIISQSQSYMLVVLPLRLLLLFSNNSVRGVKRSAAPPPSPASIWCPYKAKPFTHCMKHMSSYSKCLLHYIFDYWRSVERSVNAIMAICCSISAICYLLRALRTRLLLVTEAYTGSAAFCVAWFHGALLTLYWIIDFNLFSCLIRLLSFWRCYCRLLNYIWSRVRFRPTLNYVFNAFICVQLHKKH